MSTLSDTASRAAGGLQTGGVARMAVIGVIGWALGALFIRYANAAGWFEGTAEIVLFALCFPIAWGTARVLRRRGGLPPEHIVPAMAIALIAALFLDGLALTTAPWIYGAAANALLPAAAWLLFGVGAFLAAAFMEAGRHTGGA